MPLTSSTGFSGATICRVEFCEQVFALRCWPPNAPSPTRLVGLHRLLDHTFRMGLTQIAVPRPSLSGETLIQQDGRWWQLEPWMPGRADFHSHPSRNRLQDCLQVLARWHVSAQQFVPQAAESLWFTVHRSAPSPGLRERWLAINQWRSKGDGWFRRALQSASKPELRDHLTRIWQQFESLAPAVSHTLERLLEEQVPLQPALRDVWHDHLLFTGEQLTGLIDPSACRTENVTTDLARLLGSLVENDHIERAFALDCYQAVRPLSLVELQLLSAFDASGVLLSGMTWLEWLLVDQRQFANAEQVRARIEMVIRRMTQLRV